MLCIQGTNFYSVEETSKILGVSKKTLYNWREKAESDNSKESEVSLRPVTALNGRVLFRENEIIAVLSSRYGIEVTPATLKGSRTLVSTS